MAILLRQPLVEAEPVTEGKLVRYEADCERG